MYIITHLKCWNKMCICKIEISFNCINVHDNFFVESKNQIKTYFFFLKKKWMKSPGTDIQIHSNK